MKCIYCGKKFEWNDTCDRFECRSCNAKLSLEQHICAQTIDGVIEFQLGREIADGYNEDGIITQYYRGNV